MIITLAITYDCSRGCGYCFQRSERAFGLPHMSLQDYVRAMHWLRRANHLEFKITGGEPTQHPEFVTFCELAREHGSRLVLMTNGSFDFSALPHIDVLSGAFVHMRPASELPPEQEARVLSSIEFLQSAGVPVVLSYTITEPGRLREMVYLAKSLRKASLRIDLARSDLTRSNDFVPIGEYRQYGDEFIEAANLAEEGGVALTLDCPLPLCMFNEKQRDHLRTNGLRGVCTPFPIINPDLSVGCCPYPGLLQCRLNEIRPDTLEHRLLNHEDLEVLRWLWPMMRECEACSLWKKKQCQGGCIRGKPVLPKNACHALPFLTRGGGAY